MVVSYPLRVLSLSSRMAGSLSLPLLGWCAACAGGGAERSAGTDSVYVGLAVVDASDPRPYRNGARLALAVLNAGRAPEHPPLGIREPPAGAATVVSIARTLRDDPDVVGVVGHARDGPTLEAAHIYGDRAPVVLISPTAAYETTAAASNWVFRLAPTTRTVARAAASFTVDSLRATRSAVLYHNDRAGREFVGEFARAFVGAGGALVARDPYLDESAFDAYVPRFTQRGAAGVIIAGPLAQILTATRAVGASGGPTAALVIPEPWEDVTALDGPVGLPVRVVAAFDAERPRSRAAAEFLAAYTNRYGTPVDPRAALAYDATMLIGRAAREEGADRRRVRDWIARTGRGRPAHSGATGSVVFDASGNPVNKAVVFVDPAR
jgi:branched-chain amino acid transport system substrate-binding protein